MSGATDAEVAEVAATWANERPRIRHALATRDTAAEATNRAAATALTANRSAPSAPADLEAVDDDSLFFVDTKGLMPMPGYNPVYSPFPPAPFILRVPGHFTYRHMEEVYDEKFRGELKSSVVKRPVKGLTGGELNSSV
eukprot:297702-Prorocentrum_minimum.AAC.1